MLIWLLKTIKIYMNCYIILVLMGIVLSIIGNFLSSAQKDNWQKLEHNRPGLTCIGSSKSI